MKRADRDLYANPEAAARKLVELAAGIAPVQDGRIYIEKLNEPFLYTLKANGAEFDAGIKYAVEKEWLQLHMSGTFVRLLKGGRDMLASACR
ncbi:hypothetical protein [Streptomyces sp. AcH 505]|uniref:hypothetical protein n=1 Tax=Streptomyces sp. AcH 505 TaxID=352211 RepID=UPI0005AA09A6